MKARCAPGEFRIAEPEARAVQFPLKTFVHKKISLHWEISFSSENLRSLLKFLGGDGEKEYYARKSHCTHRGPADHH